MCWVFDLQRTEPDSDDFNLAQLKCLLKTIAPVGKEDVFSIITFPSQPTKVKIKQNDKIKCYDKDDKEVILKFKWL